MLAVQMAPRDVVEPERVTIDEPAAGRITHAALADLLPRLGSLEHPLGAAIAEAVEHVLPTLPPAARKVARDQGETMVGVFVTQYAARPPWRYIGFEVPLGSRRADHVLARGRQREVRIDELKTGSLLARSIRRAVAPQITELIEAGSARWGDRFTGVRLISLADRAEVLLTSALGVTEWVNHVLPTVIRPGRDGVPLGTRLPSQPRFDLETAQTDAVAELGSMRVAWLLTRGLAPAAPPYRQYRMAALKSGRAVTFRRPER